MTGFQFEIQLVAVVVAMACALPGVFLVLRQMAMMSDAISHAILPGIVVGFFLTQDLNSPLLVGAAALTGLLTVVLVETLQRTRLVHEDAAIGLVFPALFSIGVILIARFAGDVHLDTDAVLLGELAFVPFDRLVAWGVDLGPRSLWVMSGILLLNVLFIGLFYKELEISTFDSALATALGFFPGLLHYALMGLVSITAVGAFDAVGSILVVALMIGPPATAYLLTERLGRMIALSVACSVVGAIAGYWLAEAMDVSIAGMMATATGLLFAVALVLAPERGMLALALRRRRQRWTFASKMLVIHLLHHEGGPDAHRECRVQHLQEHLGWGEEFADEVVRRSRHDDLVERTNGHLVLTPRGRALAHEAVVQV
jgi:manganese/zinc/iron transport system permease protein